MRYAASLHALLYLSSILFAQSGVVTGAIDVEIVDTTGLRVPGARMTLKNDATGFARSAAVSDSGRAMLTGLGAGRYALEIVQDGFQPARVEVSISAGQTLSQRIVLTPGTVTTRLDVEGHSELMQAAASGSSVVLGGDRIEEAPSPNRNYLGFVLSAPAIASSPGANTMRSAAGIRNPSNDTGFTFAGMRGRNNGMTIDGADNRDETTGANRVAIGLEMVQEFRVAGASASAEFGGAAGANVNVITRSGENLWHGDATFFTQNEALNARNAEARTSARPEYRRYQPGVSLGGPLRRDKTFFYSAVEQSQESVEEWSESSGADYLINRMLQSPALRAAGVRSLQPGLFPSGERDTEGTFKLAHRLQNYHQFTARYAYSRGRVRNDAQAGNNFADVSARGSSLTADHSLVAGWTAILSASRTNDLRGQWSRRDAGVTPNASGPMVEIPGLISLGQNYLLDQQRRETHTELVDSFQLVRSGHLLSIGASAHDVRFRGRLANRFGGIYVFPTLDSFLAGRPDLAIQAFGRPEVAMATTPVGAWVQDRWQIRRGLTLDAGLRYDRQWMPAPIPVSNRSLSPRLGLAWNPAGTSAWVVRMGAGIFHDRYPLAFLNDGLQKDGVHASEVFLTGDSASAAFARNAGGAILSIPTGSIPTGARPSLYRFASDFPATYSFKASAGVERRIDADTVLTVDYTFLRGLHLPRIRNAAGVLPPVYELSMTSHSRYNGVTAAMNRRLRKELAYLVSYTLGAARDDASDFDEHPLDPANLRRDWARSRFAQRHRLAASVVYELPLDDLPLFAKALSNITAAPVVRTGSARPLNTLLTSDVYRTGAYPISARPPGVARNSAGIKGEMSIDLRLMKTIPLRENRARLQFGAESFNILNHTNYVRANPYIGAALGGLVEAGNPRQVQLFAQFEY